MSRRQNLFWLVLALVLGGLVFVHHRYANKPPSGPKRILPSLRSSGVASIQIKPGGQPGLIEVERTNNNWVITEPIAYPAQTSRLENFLKTLEQLTAAAYIGPRELKKHPRPDEEFGLVVPQFSVILQGETREHILIGGRTAPGNQVYLQLFSDPGIYVVNSDLLQLLPKSDKDWRERVLLDLSGTPLDHVSVTNGTRNFELERLSTNKTWRLLLPGFTVRADNARVEEMVQSISEIRVQDFVTDNPKTELEPFGLQTPDLQVAIRQGTNLVGVLQFGKAVTNNAQEVYARCLGQNSIVSVARDLLEPWRSWEKLRDRYLIELPASISSVEVQGQDNFSLERGTNQNWRVMPQNFAADPGLVKELLVTVGGMQIVSFVRDLVPKSDLGAYGLTNISLRYTIKGFGTNSGSAAAPAATTNTIEFGATKEDKVFVQRTDENHVYAVKFSDFQQLGSASWQFRERRIWKINQNDIARVSIRQAGRTRQIDRKAQYDWALAPGSEGVIEPLAVDQTVAGLCDLAASAWVARGEASRAAYGFTNEAFVIAIEMKNGDKRVLELGRASRSGFPYAGIKLDADFWIAELPPLLCRDVVRYLGFVSRTP